LALVSGTSMPAWLVLLARSLDTFNDIGSLLRISSAEEVANLLWTEFIRLVAGFAIVGAVSMLSGFGFITIWTYTGEKQTLRIKEQYVAAIFQQDAAWFDEHNPNELPTKIASSMSAIHDALGRRIADLASNLWSGVGCLAVSFYLDAFLALIVLCSLPAAGIVVGIISIFIRRAANAANAQFAAAGGLSIETISGIKTVASLRLEQWCIDKYITLTKEAQQNSVWGGFLTSLASGMTGLIFYVVFCIAFIFGTEQVAENADKTTLETIQCFFEDCGITGAEVMSSIYGTVLSAKFFGLLAPGLNAVNLGREAAADIYDTIARIPDIDAMSDDKGEHIVEGELKGRIQFQNVQFSYPSRPDNVIFYDFDLTVEPGMSVALVGPSGSGKSTISKLLLRLYDPQKGRILVDGKLSLTELNTKWWRSQIGYVAQSPSMFPGTIRDNITLGFLDATDKEVEEAARAACAHNFIMDLPDGYQTWNSGASIQLSGGQMQRISIARAMIRNPKLLILDEATSALDTQSEELVQEALENIRQHRQVTTVSIAHRLTTIMNSDKICVIDKGSIAEDGTHTELLTNHKAGIYANLCASQGITLDSVMGSGKEEEHNQDNKTDADGAEGSEAVLKKDSSIVDVVNNKDLLVYSGVGGASTTLMTDVKLYKDDDVDADPQTEALTQNDEGEAADGATGGRESDWELLGRLWDHNDDEKWYLLGGLFGAIIVGALPAIEGILTAQIISNFYTESAANMRLLNYRFAFGFLGLALMALVGHVAFGCCFSVAGYRLTRRMRTMSFEAIVRHSMGWFDVPEHSVGELSARLEEDADAVSKVTGWSLGYRIQVVATLAAGIIVSLIFSWRIGLIALACVPLIVASSVVQSVCSRPFDDSHMGEHWVPANTVLETGMRGIINVHAFNLQNKFDADYRAALAPAAALKPREGLVAGVVFGLSQFAVFGSFALLLYAGAMFMIRGYVSFDAFFTSILAIMFGSLGISQVNADFSAQQEGFEAASRVFGLLDDPLDDKDPFGPEGHVVDADCVTGTIGFSNVEFHYPTRPTHPVYYKSPQGPNGFNLHIDSKKSVAFVGKSGCGKSTALQILLRFYDASEGVVSLDAKDTTGLNLASLRSNIGYVGQNPVLFAGTIRQNLALGKQGATQAEMEAACKAANAHDFIVTQLSNGYDTDIGAEGSLLSGGQKQRIAIARAIISNPNILVLDEATSALDNESEKSVQAALDALQAKQPRTTLMVAHRLMTVKDCDHICVLDGGSVKEFGTHDELLQQKGLYHLLWSQQVGEDTP
jgi:ATP-binding cassette subfamily B (MDR/TAP) protein 1